MFYVSLCGECCEVNFVQDIVEDMELIQRTSDLKWINQFIRQYVMHKISKTEKWLKYKNPSVCFHFFFWRRMDRQPLVSGTWKMTCRKGKNCKHKYIVQGYVNRKNKLEEWKFLGLQAMIVEAGEK